jgi:DNA repair protein RadC
MSAVECPELQLLAQVLGESAAWLVAQAPGGWRTLSHRELLDLGISTTACAKVAALQELTSRSRPVLKVGELTNSDSVGRVYSARLGGLVHEVVLAVALNGRNRVMAELELASGGRHGAALTAADVFRPVIRTGASAFVLVHNHPSGDSRPSAEDVTLTRIVRRLGDALGVPLVDHVVVTSTGHTSLFERGFLEEMDHEARSSDEAVSA